MFRRTSRRSLSGCEDIHHSCTVRFLDETEPLTVTFQVVTSFRGVPDFPTLTYFMQQFIYSCNGKLSYF